MYAVLGKVQIDPARGDEAEKMLNEMVLPGVKAAPGLVSAFFVRSLDGTTGTSIVVFDSKEHAEAGATMREGPPPGAPVTPVSLEVVQVLAHI